MGRFLLRRLLYSILVLFGVSLLVFITLRLSGDPVQLLLRDGNPTEEDIERLRHALKLDRPPAYPRSTAVDSKEKRKKETRKRRRRRRRKKNDRTPSWHGGPFLWHHA